MNMNEDQNQARAFWDEKKDNVIKRIKTVDHRFFISEDKDKFQTEVNKVAREDNTNVTILDVLGWMNASFHRLHYNLRTGEPLSTMILSTTVIDAAFNRRFLLNLTVRRLMGILHIRKCSWPVTSKIL